MLIVPLGLENPPRERPLIAAILAVLLVYQAILMFLFGELRPDPFLLMKTELTNPWLYWDFSLGLIRSLSPVQTLLFFLFWGVLGPGLEEKTGKLLLLVTFFGASLLAFMGGRLELLAWERGCWPGLAGMMACLGLAYYFLWESEVKFFYFFPTPFIMPVGFSTMASLFVVLFFHLVVVLTEINFYTAREAKLRPPGVATALWALLLPLLVLVGCLLGNKLVAFVRQSREMQVAET